MIPTTSGEATSGGNYEFPTRHERQFQFPKSWFSRRGEKQIPTTRGGASSGRNSFFFTTTAKPQLGELKLP